MKRWLLISLGVWVTLLNTGCGPNRQHFQLTLVDGYGGQQYLASGGAQGCQICDTYVADGSLGGYNGWFENCHELTWEATLKKYPKQRQQILGSKKYFNEQ